MTTYTLAISNLTHVEVGYQPPLLAGDAFARGLIIGTTQNARIAPNQLYGIYSSLDAVKADYSDQAPEYRIAQQYFAQIPRPKDLMIATSTVPESALTDMSDFADGAEFVNKITFSKGNLEQKFLEANLQPELPHYRIRIEMAIIGTLATNTAIYHELDFEWQLGDFAAFYNQTTKAGESINLNDFVMLGVFDPSPENISVTLIHPDPGVQVFVRFRGINFKVEDVNLSSTVIPSAAFKAADGVIKFALHS